jgi:hypothetical protein
VLRALHVPLTQFWLQQLPFEMHVPVSEVQAG